MICIPKVCTYPSMCQCGEICRSSVMAFGTHAREDFLLFCKLYPKEME
jgi:hypothetical protein